jgi:hypothetical protein
MHWQAARQSDHCYAGLDTVFANSLVKRLGGEVFPRMGFRLFKSRGSSTQPLCPFRNLDARLSRSLAVLVPGGSIRLWPCSFSAWDVFVCGCVSSLALAVTKAESYVAAIDRSSSCLPRWVSSSSHELGKTLQALNLEKL